LAVDGGGVRGVVPAAVLDLWQKEGANVEFDAYSGTSTGSIVAAGLALGRSPKQVLDLFVDHVPRIFTQDALPLREKLLAFKGWAKPAYSGEALRAALVGEFGDATLGDVPKPLAINALDVVTGTTRTFRSHHHPGSAADRNVTLVDAVLASTAAPSFFPSATVAGSSFIDGGMWANNPALIALLDARALGAEDPRLVSLGTGRLFWGRNVGFGTARGLIGWGAPLIVLMMSAQSQGVDGYVRRLLPEERYLRVDPALPRELAGLDEPDAIPALLVRAAEAARGALGDFRDLG
jgi:hypothetical protein